MVWLRTRASLRPPPSLWSGAGRPKIPKRQTPRRTGIPSSIRQLSPQLVSSLVPKVGRGNPLRQQGLRRAKRTFGTAPPRFSSGPKKDKKVRARARSYRPQAMISVATIRNCRLEIRSQALRAQQLKILSPKTRLRPWRQNSRPDYGDSGRSERPTLVVSALPRVAPVAVCGYRGRASDKRRHSERTSSF